MNKQDAIKKLEEAGVDAGVIAALTADDGTADRLAALEARLEAESGKAAGILEGKKKAQQKAEELQAKLEEIEGKDLGEVEKLQRELERRDSLVESLKAESEKIKGEWSAEKRSAQLSKIGSNLKWLESVPEKIRELTIQNDFADIEDLGNEVLVKDRLSSLTESYAGLLASDAPSGAGSRSGNGTGSSSASADALSKPNLSEVAKDPAAYMTQALAAED